MANLPPLATLAKLAKLAKYILLGQILGHLAKYYKYIYINNIYILYLTLPNKESEGARRHFSGVMGRIRDLTIKIHMVVDFLSMETAPPPPERMIHGQIVDPTKTLVYKGIIYDTPRDVANFGANVPEKTMSF